MTFIKILIVLGIIAFAGYYLTNSDDFNSKVSNDLKTGSDYFIDKSNQIITVVDLWANGPKQNYATSGSENINFQTEEVKLENDVLIPAIVQPTSKEKELNLCESNFKDCVDRAHAEYGVYISVKEVKTFNDNSASDFYNSKKSAYQPAWDGSISSFPLTMIEAEAVGIGSFVATCKDGVYPKELNQGLPC
jgi:hypothetical protein